MASRPPFSFPVSFWVLALDHDLQIAKGTIGSVSVKDPAETKVAVWDQVPLDEGNKVVPNFRNDKLIRDGPKNKRNGTALCPTITAKKQVAPLREDIKWRAQLPVFAFAAKQRIKQRKHSSN